MKRTWRYMEVYADAPLKCTICGASLPANGACSGVAHVPNDVNDEEYTMLRAMWGVDPYADLIVCDGCMKEGKVWGDAESVKDGLRRLVTTGEMRASEAARLYTDVVGGIFNVQTCAEDLVDFVADDHAEKELDNYFAEDCTEVFDWIEQDCGISTPPTDPRRGGGL